VFWVLARRSRAVRADTGDFSRLTASSSSVAATVGPSCAVPMPGSATRPAQYGWSAIWGYHYLRSAGPGGRRRGARAAVVHDGGHPAKQCLLVDLADGEAVVPVVDWDEIAPTAGDERAAGGSTSPRPPYVHNSTRTSCPPFPQVVASADDCAARPGSCRKPPGALYVGKGKELVSPFPLSSAMDGQPPVIA
jgi:hypothetical protein